MKKLAKDLQPGDRMMPPAGERGWLKTPITVLSVLPGRTDKGGLWLAVRASFQSPYSADRASESHFSFRPDTAVRCL